MPHAYIPREAWDDANCDKLANYNIVYCQLVEVSVTCIFSLLSTDL